MPRRAAASSSAGSGPNGCMAARMPCARCCVKTRARLITTSPSSRPYAARPDTTYVVSGFCCAWRKTSARGAMWPALCHPIARLARRRPRLRSSHVTLPDVPDLALAVAVHMPEGTPRIDVPPLLLHTVSGYIADARLEHASLFTTEAEMATNLKTRINDRWSLRLRIKRPTRTSRIVLLALGVWPTVLLF